MPYHDTIEPQFRRLLKADGHLGALYNPISHTLRLVCRAGTVDFDLKAFDEQAARREARDIVTEQGQ